MAVALQELRKCFFQARNLLAFSPLPFNPFLEGRQSIRSIRLYPLSRIGYLIWMQKKCTSRLPFVDDVTLSYNGTCRNRFNNRFRDCFSARICLQIPLWSRWNVTALHRRQSLLSLITLIVWQLTRFNWYRATRRSFRGRLASCRSARALL